MNPSRLASLDDAALTQAYVAADTRSPEYAAIRAELNRRIASGNGADLDNLEAAATPLEVEPRAGDGREAERAAFYDKKQADYVDTYGLIGVGDAPPPTAEQYGARRNLQMREREARHTPHQEDARLARLAKRAGIPVEDATAMTQAGYDDYAEQKNTPGWNVAGINNTTSAPDFQQMVYAHRMLKKQGDDRRNAELEARQQAVVRSRMARANPLEYMNRADVSDESRSLVADQMRPPGRRRDQGDPRIRVADIGAASAEAQAAAEREARVSQQQWLEQTRIAAEERAAARAEANAAAQRTFDAEQKGLDREAQAAAGDAAREAAAAQRQADLDVRRQEHEQTMLRLGQADAAAQRRHEESLAANQEQAAQSRQQFEARYGLDERKMEADKKATEEAMARAEREQLLRSMESEYGEGVRSIDAGDYGTPAAEDSLKAMAKDSDQGWFGFWEADGRRMDAILSRLGVTDPDARRALVERFGYGSPGLLPGSGDGRGGLLSYWLAGRQ